MFLHITVIVHPRRVNSSVNSGAAKQVVDKHKCNFDYFPFHLVAPLLCAGDVNGKNTFSYAFGGHHNVSLTH